MQNWRKNFDGFKKKIFQKCQNSQIFAIFWGHAIRVEYIWLHFILNCTCSCAAKIMNQPKRFYIKLKMNFSMKERVFCGLSADMMVTADVTGSSSDWDTVHGALIKVVRRVYQKKLE